MPGFSINTTTMSGNLTRDPELRSLPSGTSLCKIGVAVNERFKDESGNWADRPNYFDWTIWSGMGEWVAKNLSKGDGVALEGRARWRSWETEDGSKRSAVDFTANSVVPIGRRDRDGGGRSDVPASTDDFKPVASSGGPADDDIPF